MRHEDAMELIHAGVASAGGIWADLGAGGGVFTRALADLLGANGVVVAVDVQASVEALARPRGTPSAQIRTLRADFRQPLSTPMLDGVLMANALHFVSDPASVLERVLERIRPGGAFVLVEYDIAHRTPWIPHPIPSGRVADLAQAVGLVDVREIGRTASRFGRRDIYAAAARRA